MAEEASRRESALPVNSARWALEPCSSCHLVSFGPHRLQLEGEPEFDGDFDGPGGGGLASEDAPLWERIKTLNGFGPPRLRRVFLSQKCCRRRGAGSHSSAGGEVASDRHYASVTARAVLAGKGVGGFLWCCGEW